MCTPFIIKMLWLIVDHFDMRFYYLKYWLHILPLQPRLAIFLMINGIPYMSSRVMA